MISVETLWLKDTKNNSMYLQQGKELNFGIHLPVQVLLHDGGHK